MNLFIVITAEMTFKMQILEILQNNFEISLSMEFYISMSLCVVLKL